MITLDRLLIVYALIGLFILPIGLLYTRGLQAHPYDASHSHKHESAIRVLAENLPLDRDIVYVSSYISGGSSENIKTTAVVNVMKQDGTAKKLYFGSR